MGDKYRTVNLCLQSNLFSMKMIPKFFEFFVVTLTISASQARDAREVGTDPKTAALPPIAPAAMLSITDAVNPSPKLCRVHDYGLK